MIDSYLKNHVVSEMLLFELIANLCFVVNAKVWEKNEIYGIVQQVGSGYAILNLEDENITDELVKFITGLTLSVYFLKQFIGAQNSLVVSKLQTGIYEVATSESSQFEINVMLISEDYYSFLHEAFNSLFSRKILIIDKNLFDSIKTMFSNVYKRLGNEAGYLKKLKKSLTHSKSFTISNININSFLLLMAVLPVAQLNRLIMKIGAMMSDNDEIMTSTGMKIYTKSYLTYDTQELKELYPKLKVISYLTSSNNEEIHDILYSEELVRFLNDMLNESDVHNNILKYLSETLQGQYLPRLNILKAFLKLLPN